MILTLAQLVCGLVLGVCLLRALWYQPLSAIWATMLLLIYRSFSLVEPAVGLGGTSVYVSDLFGLSLLGIAFIRFCAKPVWLRPISIPLAASLVNGMLLLSFVAGIQQFGVTLAALEFRAWLLPLALLSYGLTYRSDVNFAESAMRIWAQVAWVFTLLAGYFWLAYYTGLPYPDLVKIASEYYYTVPRVLFAQQAMVLLIGTFFAWWGWSQLGWSKSWRWRLPLMVMAAIGVQHRTIWVAGLCMVAYLLVTSGAARKGLTTALVMGILIGATFLYATPANPLTESLVSTTEAATEENSTFTWRLEGWRILLSRENMGGIENYVTGLPMGSGWYRIIGFSEVDVSPHNQFVQMLLRGGLIGLIALLVLYINIFRNVGNDPRAHAIRVALVGTALYWITYGTSPTDSIVFLMGMALIQQQQVRCFPVERASLTR